MLANLILQKYRIKIQDTLSIAITCLIIMILISMLNVANNNITNPNRIMMTGLTEDPREIRRDRNQSSNPVNKSYLIVAVIFGAIVLTMIVMALVSWATSMFNCIVHHHHHTTKQILQHSVHQTGINTVTSTVIGITVVAMIIIGICCAVSYRRRSNTDYQQVNEEPLRSPATQS